MCSSMLAISDSIAALSYVAHVSCNSQNHGRHCLRTVVFPCTIWTDIVSSVKRASSCSKHHCLSFVFGIGYSNLKTSTSILGRSLCTMYTFRNTVFWLVFIYWKTVFFQGKLDFLIWNGRWVLDFRSVVFLVSAKNKTIIMPWFGFCLYDILSL